MFSTLLEDFISLLAMAFFESFGRRKKNGIDDEKYLGHDHERLAYNDRISRMRKSEYPMLKGMLI